MMVIDKKTNHDRKCRVIHFASGPSTIRPTAAVKEEEVDIFERGDNVFRIKYPERCAPDQGIEQLRKNILEVI